MMLLDLAPIVDAVDNPETQTSPPFWTIEDGLLELRYYDQTRSCFFLESGGLRKPKALRGEFTF